MLHFKLLTRLIKVNGLDCRRDIAAVKSSINLLLVVYIRCVYAWFAILDVQSLIELVFLGRFAVFDEIRHGSLSARLAW